MLELIVEHQAGMPILIKPLSGNSSDAKEFGQTVRDHIAQLQTTYGTTYLVADSALYSADNLGKLQDTHTKWITRVPATLSEAQEALVQTNLETMQPLKTGYRYQPLCSTYAGVEQRWLLIYAEPRRRQAGRTVTKRWLKHSEKEAHAFKKLCGIDFACEADAQQAVRTFEHGLTAIALHAVAIRPIPHYDKPGRPKQGEVPTKVTYRIEGATASPLAAHEDLMIQESCWIVATNELDEAALSPLECVEAYQGQQHAERGFRFLKSPEFLASSLYLKKAERIMAF
jgi:transposase